MSNAGAAPTGCFKCGRPGHWSRDCPSSAPESSPNPNPSLNPNSDPSSKHSTKSVEGLGKGADKQKKAPRTRPKLTPESLLSNDGLGYVLRHFPRAFKYRGRGHEVSDLGNLIGMYEEWHSHFLPYYSFEQFVRKVEQVGSSKRVKMALRDLREKVANGGDLTRLHEMSGDQEEAKDSEDPRHNGEDAIFQNQDDFMQDEILQDIHKKANEDASLGKTLGNTSQLEVDFTSKGTEADKVQEEPNQQNNTHKPSAGNEMTEEQKARIEANRLKALEKAAARRAAAQAQSRPS